MSPSCGSTRTLVIGLSPEVNRSVVEPLLEAGIEEHAAPLDRATCLRSRAMTALFGAHVHFFMEQVCGVMCRKDVSSFVFRFGKIRGLFFFKKAGS